VSREHGNSISVARLPDPWSTPHQLSDDLEPFFWVLLYQVVRYRDRTKVLKESMADVFDQYETKTVGRSRGGKGKLAVFGGTELPTPIILSLTSRTSCYAIIEELRALFHDFYRHVFHLTTPEPEVVEMYQKLRETVPLVQNARDKLQSSDAFLAILENHLTSAWDVDDDGSLDPSEPLLDPSASRNSRKREAEDSNDGGRNIHLRRRGLMPPRSRERSRDEVSSQTFSSRDELFSMQSRMRISSSVVPSRTPRTSDDGPSSLEHSLCMSDRRGLVSLHKYCTIQAIPGWGPFFWWTTSNTAPCRSGAQRGLVYHIKGTSASLSWLATKLVNPPLKLGLRPGRGARSALIPPVMSVVSRPCICDTLLLS
jgi:hypothetical protein